MKKEGTKLEDSRKEVEKRMAEEVEKKVEEGVKTGTAARA
jgi:hypothetical protein